MEERGRRNLIIVLIVFTFLVLLLLYLNIPLTSAEIMQSPSEGGAPDFLGINPDNAPESPGELANQTWTNLKNVLANNTIIGPVHRWNLNHQKIYIFLFNAPYNLSLDFLLIFILWWYVLIFFTDTMEAPKILEFVGNFFLGLIVGFLISLLFAHINLFNMLVSWILIRSNSFGDSWWKQLIFWSIFVIILIFIYSMGRMLKNYRKGAKLGSEKRKVKRTAKEAEKIAIESRKEAEKARKVAEKAIMTAEQAKERFEEFKEETDNSDENKERYELAREEAEKAIEIAKEAKERFEDFEERAREAKEDLEQVKEESRTSSENALEKVERVEEKAEAAIESAGRAEAEAKDSKRQMGSLRRGSSDISKTEKRLKDIAKQEQELLDERLKK